MDALAAGLVTLFNGLIAALGLARTPVTAAFLVCAASLAWLAQIRIEQLDRQGAKPAVSRH